ncbi:MAG: hypothetical protein PHQ47_00325 [Candidatus Portnoybacteria bacterium]|nr:hypothetical protein [Candidatus Portnoybacteria bacterium]
MQSRPKVKFQRKGGQRATKQGKTMAANDNQAYGFQDMALYNASNGANSIFLRPANDWEINLSPISAASTLYNTRDTSIIRTEKVTMTAQKSGAPWRVAQPNCYPLRL